MMPNRAVTLCAAILVMACGCLLAEKRIAPESERVAVARFTVTYRGVEPQLIRVPSGKVFVFVHADPGAAQTVFRLEASGGKQIGELKASSNAARTRSEFDLPPGSYDLVAPTQPRLRGRLIVTGR